MNMVEAVQVVKQLIQSFFIRSHGETPFIHLLYSIKNYMTRGKDDFKQKAHHPGTISRMVRFRLFFFCIERLSAVLLQQSLFRIIPFSSRMKLDRKILVHESRL